jgi:hypothetical protein
LAAVGATAALGLVHALVVAQYYHVGSFDDDANYVLVARALASGAGLTSKLNGSVPVVAVYPPGYPALLAPLAFLWPHGLIPLRALSLVCFVAVFPLTWRYLERRRVAPLAALAVLLLLALNPVAATYGTMVMAEMPFVVALLLLLLVVPRWEAQPRTLTAAGGATVALVASLVWFKEAGVGLAVGVVAWLVLRRLWRKAALVGVGTSLSLVPVIAARAAAGVALIGSRYSSELGGTASGGLVHRVLTLPPSAAWAYVQTALERSIVPSDVNPLPGEGPVSIVLSVLQWTAAPLIIIGFVVWVTRHRDVACVAVPMYLLETLFFPFTNERRIILVLPVILAWYVLGGWVVLGPLVRAGRAATRRSVAAAELAVPVAAAALVLAALLPQLPRDYLFSVGENSSAPAGSPYMAFLQALGHPDDVVESSYVWSTALFSGHRSANAAYLAPCDANAIFQALRSDQAAFLLSAAVKEPGYPDGWCLLPSVAAQPGVVQLYSSPRDLASVFELIGPGSPHPDLTDLIGGSSLTPAGSTILAAPDGAQSPSFPEGSYVSTPTVAGHASLTWSWGQPSAVSQISLDVAGGAPATTTSVAVGILGPDGVWHQVAAASGPVGATEPTRYLLASFPQSVLATAVRVSIAARGPAEVRNLHVLGQRR